MKPSATHSFQTVKEEFSHVVYFSQFPTGARSLLQKGLLNTLNIDWQCTESSPKIELEAKRVFGGEF